MKRQFLIALGILALAALACGPRTNRQSNAASPNVESAERNLEFPPGDPAQGERLFKGQVNGQYPCWVCHSLAPGQALVGPSLAGIADTAATRVGGYSAEQYLYESITLPKAYVVEGFNAEIMPETFAAEMDRQELADLIAFLMTQK